jgi:CheY-like chemotaxis protein
MTRSRKVLVIEDNADFAAALAAVLRLWKHEVVIVSNGEAGLLKARELEPDVIICDIGLPGELSGYAVSRALRDDPDLARAYRIALTGYAQPDDQQTAREAGFQAHLAKPADLDLLERLIAELPG